MDLASRTKSLISLLELHQFSYGVEIGVHYGHNLFGLLDKIPALHMVGVDTWCKQDVSVYADYTNTDWDKMYQYVLLSAVKYDGRVNLIKMFSSDASQLFDDKTFDFVFIDANHSYDAVKEDIVLWYPKVVVGGIVSGHDIGMEGVNKAVDEILGIDNISIYGEVWYTIKNE